MYSPSCLPVYVAVLVNETRCMVGTM